MSTLEPQSGGYKRSEPGEQAIPQPLQYNARLIYFVEPWNGPVYISEETRSALDPDRPS